jgi:cytochrome P450
MSRLVLRPFTFSNGVTIPEGAIVAASLGGIHTDEEIYPNPEQFDGFRFLKLRDDNHGVATTGHLAGSTSHDHLTFGLGRHAW